MSLKDAFNIILKKKRRPIRLHRIGAATFDIQTYVSPSNYFRNGAAPSEMTVFGHQFIITTSDLSAYPGKVKRGDRIEDPELGTLTIETIEPLHGLGADILGFRITTG